MGGHDPNIPRELEERRRAHANSTAAPGAPPAPSLGPTPSQQALDDANSDVIGGMRSGVPFLDPDGPPVGPQMSPAPTDEELAHMLAQPPTPEQAEERRRSQQEAVARSQAITDQVEAQRQATLARRERNRPPAGPPAHGLELPNELPDLPTEYGVENSVGNLDETIGGVPVQASGPSTTGHTGMWEGEGGTNIGMRGNVTAADLDIGDGALTGNAQVLDGGVYINEDEAAIGLQGPGLAAGTNLPGQDQGISEGEGAALRFRYSDDDHDGYREIGPGVDVGPISVNARSDILHRSFDTARDVLGPVSPTDLVTSNPIEGAINAGQQLASSRFAQQVNVATADNSLVQGAQGLASEAWDWMTD